MSSSVNGDDVVNELADVGEGEVAAAADRDAVGDRRERLQTHRSTRLERRWHGGRAGRLYADHAYLRD